MMRTILMFFLLFTVSMRFHAQNVTYDIDEEVAYLYSEFGAIKVTESMLHNNNLKKEYAAAKEIDSMFQERAKSALIDVTDRSVDIVKPLEYGKIERSLNTLDYQINLIRAYGGSKATRDRWVARKGMLQEGLNAISDYQPNSKRQEQYLAVYKDAEKMIEELGYELKYLKSMQHVAEDKNVKTLDRIRAQQSRNCLTRWRYKASSKVKQ